MKRYLDEGIDRVLAAVNQASRVFIDNYVIADVILDHVREGEEVDTPVEFQKFDRHILELMPCFKIAHLIGDDIFGKVIPLLTAFIDAESIFLDSKFWPMLVDIRSKQAAGKLMVQALLAMENHLKRSSRKFIGYSMLTDELEQIILALEKQTTLNWAKLAQFKDDPEVRASIQRLKEKFGSELQEDKPKQEQKQ